MSAEANLTPPSHHEGHEPEAHESENLEEAPLKSNGPMPCKNHPHTQTRLTCSYCETPICTKCMVVCEVGLKCKKCTGKMKSHILQVSWKELAIAGGASLVTGLLFGFVYQYIQISMFFLEFILCFMIGQGCGNLVHRLVKYKLGTNLSLAIFIGASIGLALSPFQAILMEMLNAATTGDNGLYLDDFIKIVLFMVGMLQIFNWKR